MLRGAGAGSKRMRMVVALAALMAAVAAVAAEKVGAGEPVYQSSPERRVVAERYWGPWLGPFRQKLVPSLMQDFGERYLYADANRAMAAPEVQRRFTENGLQMIGGTREDFQRQIAADRQRWGAIIREHNIRPE